MEREDFKRRVAELVGDQKPFAWGQLIGLSPGVLNRMWNDGVIPKADSLLKIRKATGVSLDWFIAGEGPKYSKNINEGNEPQVEYKNIITPGGRMNLSYPVTEPEKHLQHNADFVQAVVQKVLSQREIPAPQALTRRELELLYIFKRISKNAEILSDFEQSALECYIQCLHEEAGIYDPEEEKLKGDPREVKDENPWF